MSQNENQEYIWNYPSGNYLPEMFPEERLGNPAVSHFQNEGSHSCLLVSL